MDRVYLHGENGDASQFGVSRDFSQHLILLSNYKVEDVYNMDGMFFLIEHNQIRPLHKERWKIEKFRKVILLLPLL